MGATPTFEATHARQWWWWVDKTSWVMSVLVFIRVGSVHVCMLVFIRVGIGCVATHHNCECTVVW